MNEPLSHVDYLALNVQALLDERFAGKATRLGKHAQMNPKAIRRVLAGQPCRLQTVDKLAQTCGMAVGEMFLKPGTQTDWYSNTNLHHFSANLLSAIQEAGQTFHDVDSETGKPHGIIKFYVDGVQYPQTNTLQKIAEALDTEVADLFLPPDGGD